MKKKQSSLPKVTVKIDCRNNRSSCEVQLVKPVAWCSDKKKRTETAEFTWKNRVRDVLRIYGRQSIFCDYHKGYAPNVLKSFGDSIDLDFRTLYSQGALSESFAPIVFVLESPHDSEYCHELNPRGPAMGTTGQNLHNLLRLCDLEHPLLNNPIVICNPVPWQCSLFQLHGRPMKDGGRYIANFVWRQLWEKDFIQDFFGERLREMNPKLIVNCCTMAKPPEETDVKTLRTLVSEYLRDKPEKFRFTEMAHPSHWKKKSLAERLKSISDAWKKATI